MQNVKQELQKIYHIKCRIDRLKSRKEDIEEMVKSIHSPVLSLDKVQTSIGGDKLLKAIAQMDDIECRIADEIKDLETEKDRITTKIESIPDERYKILLYDRYVRFHRWEQIAVDMRHDIRYIYRLHGEALKAYGK